MRNLLVLFLFLTATRLLAQPSPAPGYRLREIITAPLGDGGPARQALFDRPFALATDPAGHIYIGELAGRIRRIDPAGAIITIAGLGDGVSSGDNGPARSAGLAEIYSLAFSGGFLYLAERGDSCLIRRIQISTGIITRVAGTGACTAAPNGPALTTPLRFPGSLAFDRDNNLHFTEDRRIRKLVNGQLLSIHTPTLRESSIAFEPSGRLLIADGCRLRALSPFDQRVETISAQSDFCRAASGDGGLLRNAFVGKATALALDPTGSELYFSDEGPSANTTVTRLVNLSSQRIERYLGSSSGPGEENVSSTATTIGQVTSYAFDSAGNLLVADVRNGRVGRVLRTSRNFEWFAGRDSTPHRRVVDLQAGAAGSFAFVDPNSETIRAADASGAVRVAAGTGLWEPTRSSRAVESRILPRRLHWARSGNLYFWEVVRPGARALRRVTAAGQLETLATVETAEPWSLLVDPEERFAYYAADRPNGFDDLSRQIFRLDLRANAIVGSRIAGTDSLASSGDGGPATQASLWQPISLALDSRGRLYIAEFGANRIRRIDPNGIIQTIAGTGTIDLIENEGPALQVRLKPSSLCLDARDNLYISDRGRFLRYDPNTGQIQRIAGRLQSRGVTSTVRGLGAFDFQEELETITSAITNSRSITCDPAGNVAITYGSDRAWLLTPDSAPPTSAAPRIASAIAAGNFGAGPTIAPGSWLEIYGERFTPGASRQWAGSDFQGNRAPTTLDGVRVQVDGRDAFLQLVSPGQINAVVPDGIRDGRVEVRVITAQGPSEPFTLTAARRAPALLAPPAFRANGRQYVAALHADGVFAGPPDLIPGAAFRPARAGDALVLYGIGFGATNPTIPAGEIASAAAALPDVAITLNGAPATLLYAGPAVGFVGLYQLNLVVPPGLSSDAAVALTVQGVPATQNLVLGLNP